MRRNQLELALDHAQSSLAAALGGLPAGWLRLETWAPGDGWTRYRLLCGDAVGPASAPARFWVGPYMRRRAMLDTLAAMAALGDQINRMRRAAAEQRRAVEG